MGPTSIMGWSSAAETTAEDQHAPTTEAMDGTIQVTTATTEPTTKVMDGTIIIIIIIIKKDRNARPGEGDWHPISPKTPEPHYQPIDEKKRMGK